MQHCENHAFLEQEHHSHSFQLIENSFCDELPVVYVLPDVFVIWCLPFRFFCFAWFFKFHRYRSLIRIIIMIAMRDTNTIYIKKILPIKYEVPTSISFTKCMNKQFLSFWKFSSKHGIAPFSIEIGFVIFWRNKFAICFLTFSLFLSASWSSGERINHSRKLSIWSLGYSSFSIKSLFSLKHFISASLPVSYK